MKRNIFQALPQLPCEYKDLEPYMSEKPLRIHHRKHHQAYVNAVNAIFQKIDRARKEGADLDVKSTLKELSFNIGGHLLHSLFWANLAPAGRGGGKPDGVRRYRRRLWMGSAVFLQADSHN